MNFRPEDSGDLFDAVAKNWGKGSIGAVLVGAGLWLSRFTLGRIVKRLEDLMTEIATNTDETKKLNTGLSGLNAELDARRKVSERHDILHGQHFETTREHGERIAKLEGAASYKRARESQ